MSIINFIYQNKQYPIDLKLLKKHSNYFSQIKESRDNANNIIFLIDEFDSYQRYSEETIQAFIQYFKTQEIELDTDNIFSIKYLSSKYEVSDLINQANKYINDNYKDLIEQFLTMHENQKYEIYEIQSEENLLSYHISEYISDDRLTSLPLNVLYRLLSKTSNKKQIQSKKIKTKNKKNLKKAKNVKKIKPKLKLKTQNEMMPKLEDTKIVDFLIKTVKCQGIEATILFKAVELSKEGIDYLIDQLRKEIESDESIDIDFNLIKKEIILYLSYKKEDDVTNAEIEKENQRKLKDDLFEKFDDVEEEQENCRNEIKSQINDLRNEIDHKIDEKESNMNEITSAMRTEFDEIKSAMMKEIDELKRELKEVKSEMISERTKMQEEIKSITDNYDATIDEIKEKMNKEKKNLLDIISIISIHKDNKYFKLLAYLCEENIQSKEPTELFDKIFIPNSTKSIKEIANETSYISEFEENGIGFHSKAIEMLYSNDKFNPMKFSNELIDFSKITFDVQSSNQNFDDILKNIGNLQNQIFKKNQNVSIDIIIDLDEKQQQETREYLLKNISSLSEITIPSTKTKIGSIDIKNCNSLINITIPTNEKENFTQHSLLSKIIVPTPITKIFENAFENNILISEIIIPSSITIIEAKSFRGCSSLKKIVIPETVISIGKKCFSECTSLCEIVIPKLINKIEQSTFKGCTNLKKITIPKGIEIVDNNAFSECSSLTNIDLL